MSALLADRPSNRTLEEAYARCETLAKTHYENFTVGSWFLPKDARRYFYSIYAFCRSVDDLGDELPGDRMKALTRWEREITRCYSGTPDHPYMVALQDTIRTFDIPIDPFLKLVQANRMDQTINRFPTFADLEHYCRHSANPVGHLVLYVSGYRDKHRQSLSDHTCTALQLTNFWQDVSRDYAKGRIYIPQEDMDRFGYTERDLDKGIVNDAFRALMQFQTQRARDLFDKGLALVDTLSGRLKTDVALFSLGGMKILDAIERQGYDVLSRRPTLSRAAKVRLMLGTALRLKLPCRP